MKTNEKADTRVKMTSALAINLHNYVKKESAIVGLLFGTNNIADEFIPVLDNGMGLVIPNLYAADITHVYLHANKTNKQIMGTAYIQTCNRVRLQAWLEGQIKYKMNDKIKYKMNDNINEGTIKEAILRYHGEKILDSFPQPIYWVDFNNDQHWRVV